MLNTLTKSSFDPYLNDIFKIHTDSVGIVDTTLVEITEKKRGATESFSLIFKGPKEKEFQQKTHGVAHPEMGEFTLFLVPVLYEKNDAMYYQAIFTRIIE